MKWILCSFENVARQVPLACIRQDGNKEFPVKYDSFVVTEFYGRIMEAKYALRWSRDNHVVLFEDSKCTSGKEML